MKKVILLIAMVFLSTHLNAQVWDNMIPQVIKCATTGVNYITDENGEYIDGKEWFNRYRGKTYRRFWGSNISYDEADHIKVGEDILWNYKHTLQFDSHGKFYWTRVFNTYYGSEELIRRSTSLLTDVTVFDNYITGQIHGL